MVEVDNNHTTSKKPNYISRPGSRSEMTPGLAATICAYMGYSLHSFALVEPGVFQQTVPTLATQRAASCHNVDITCNSDRCGQRPLYRNLGVDREVPASGEGRRVGRIASSRSPGN